MRSQSGQAAPARRARVILMSADGVAFNEIRQRLGCDGDLFCAGVSALPPIGSLD